MYSNTRFNDVLNGLSRSGFERIVEQYHGDKYSKGFRCWDQLIGMIYGQLSGSNSLRELEAGFNSQSHRHYHLGSRIVKRSTLAEANTKRSHALFSTVCQQLLSHVHRTVRNSAKDLLYLMDSTPIQLKGLGYDHWAAKDNIQRNQGLKVQMLFAPEAQVPVASEISAPNINDVVLGRNTALETGATYVFDKGYYDYNWWYTISQKQAYFVTRLKANAALTCHHQYQIALKDQDTILEDAKVMFKHKRRGGKRLNHHYDTPLRRVIVNRPDKTTPLILVTNDFQRSAGEIADLYKRRWAIEIFFKWLKQNLKIKRFLGRSENAVKIQIYVALITYLLVNQYRKQYEPNTTMHLCLNIIATGLFERQQTNISVEHRRRKRAEALENIQPQLNFGNYSGQ